MPSETPQGLLTAQQEKIAALHNASIGPLVAEIIGPVIRAGGGLPDVLSLAESVVLGVTLYAVDHGYTEEVVDLLLSGVKRRLIQIRQDDALRAAPAAGSA